MVLCSSDSKEFGLLRGSTNRAGAKRNNENIEPYLHVFTNAEGQWWSKIHTLVPS